MTDHYATLGIQETATKTEIITAYRQLARIHHPDKNREDTVKATRRFQEIQLAYEVLSNDIKREQYDVQRYTHIHLADTHDIMNRVGTTWRDRYEFGRMVSELQQEARKRAYRQWELRWEAEQAQEDEARQARQNEAKKAPKSAMELEAQKQQARKDKQSTCLHSNFCEKIKQQKKFKCGACGARRGMIAFECPYCGRHLCQMCITVFGQKRERDGKSKANT